MTHVRSEAQGRIHATLPDFNLYVFAQAIRDVPEQLQKALAEQYRGPVPESLDIEDWQDDASYRGGWWLWLNLDVDALTSRSRRRRKLKSVPVQDATS
ncbi:hypothetical protein [Chitinivorax sp. B]|uniref:hypothetical protein n=1 Tax=Chitinivorax sp. B TaxID=2502235 RepID=UPI0010F6BF29|nr:hypothetical protein [Chitinivorax sp. B]